MKARVTPIGKSSHECKADMPFISQMIHNRWAVEMLSGTPNEIIQFRALLMHSKRPVQCSAGELHKLGV